MIYKNKSNCIQLVDIIIELIHSWVWCPLSAIVGTTICTRVSKSDFEVESHCILSKTEKASEKKSEEEHNLPSLERIHWSFFPIVKTTLDFRKGILQLIYSFFFKVLLK